MATPRTKPKPTVSTRSGGRPSPGTRGPAAEAARWDRDHAFNAWLRPLSPERFLERTYTKACRRFSGAADRFDSLFSMAALEDLIARNGIPPSQLFMGRAGQPQRPAGAGLEPYDLIAHVREGGSFVIHSLEWLVPSVAKLASDVRECTGMATGINAYYTCARSPTLPWHWDNHDVFLMQIHGWKKWRIYRPLFERPLHKHNFNYFPEFHERSSELAATIELGPGDMLYMPAGFPHRGETGTTDSFHLTVALFRYTYHDAVREMLERALALCESDPDFREDIGHGAEAARLRDLVDRVIGGLDWRVEGGRSPEGDLGLSIEDVRQHWRSRDVSITARTTLVPSGVRWWRRKRWGGIEIDFGGKARPLIVPSDLEPVLAFVANTKRFRPKELPRTHYGSVELTKWLVDRGLVRAVEVPR